MVIAVAVFGVMLCSLVKFRKTKGAVPDVDAGAQHASVELIWTAIPVVILVAMAVPAAQARWSRIEDTSETRR